VIAGSDHDRLQAVHVVRHCVHRPDPAAAIGDAVAAAELAEGVAGEGVPGALLFGHEESSVDDIRTAAG
jgi:hypothetical protein